MMKTASFLSFGALALVFGTGSCRPKGRTVPSNATQTTTARGAVPSPSEATARSEAEVEPSAPSVAPSRAKPPARRFGSADADPTNDREIGPPEAVPECEERLRALDATFTISELPLRNRVREIPTCGANDAVILTKLSGGLAIRPPALLTCTMALGLAHFAPRLQELAEAELGTRVKTVHHVGTYNCRKMVRFDLVSEHSYGNAIDVSAFTLESGPRLEVKRDFGKLDEEPGTPAARFLRRVGSVAFDEDFFSVSLGPYWDALHRDHYHFDQARYRVDGSRP